jgi:hypothetical protein
MSTTIQVPSLILPTIWTVGTETETIANIVTHTSIEFECEYLQEKQVHILAIEAVMIVGVIAGGPFTLGEAVTGAPSGATGVISGRGANWITVANQVGIFVAGDTITGAMSGATINGALTIAAPGNLWCWVELSPVPSTVSPLFWSAIGGGGGLLPPITPAILVGTGVNLTQHTLILPWTAHSSYGRIVIQTPILVATAFWVCQVLIAGAAK